MIFGASVVAAEALRTPYIIRNLMPEASRFLRLGLRVHLGDFVRGHARNFIVTP